MHDLELLRNATDELSVVVVPQHQIRLTTRQLFTSIDQLRVGIDRIPLAIEELEKAGETFNVTKKYYTVIKVC